MNKIKTFLSIALALTMVFMLMSCGNSEEKEAPVETTAAPVETTAAAVTEETEAPENEEAFTDSVSQKGAPAILGKLVILDQVDETIDLGTNKDKAVKEVPAEKLTVVPFAKRSGDAELLETAYQEILGAENLAALNEEVKAAAEEYKMDLDNLVVRDLISITLDPEYNAVLEEENNYLALQFDMKLAQGENMMILVRGEEGWEVLHGENILVDKDGSVLAAFETLCPVAFVVAGK